MNPIKFAPIALIALAACAQEPEKKTYEADVEDVGGGELIVTQEDPDAVPVDLPETPMTPVPVDGEEAGEEEPPAE